MPVSYESVWSSTIWEFSVDAQNLSTRLSIRPSQAVFAMIVQEIVHQMVHKVVPAGEDSPTMTAVNVRFSSDVPSLK